jgi:predicted nucleic acid-binding protein
MAARIRAYVDTSAFIAFLDRSDSYHALFRGLFSAPPPLITSALVVAEGHGWFLRRYDRRRATQFLAFINILPDLTIQPFEAAELAGATVMLKKFGDQDLTLADAHGLAVMRARSVSDCWSSDWHLGLDGGRLAIQR